jgi:hypothetical protein
MVHLELRQTYVQQSLPGASQASKTSKLSLIILLYVTMYPQIATLLQGKVISNINFLHQFGLIQAYLVAKAC